MDGVHQSHQAHGALFFRIVTGLAISDVIVVVHTQQQEHNIRLVLHEFLHAHKQVAPSVAPIIAQTRSRTDGKITVSFVVRITSVVWGIVDLSTANPTTTKRLTTLSLYHRVSFR